MEAAEEPGQRDDVDLEALTRPFEAGEVKQRPGPGRKAFSYVSGQTVIGRLLTAAGSAFSWKVERVELVTQETGEGPTSYWMVLGLLSVRGLGVRAGIGTHPAESVEAPKAAETDALKRAAVKFGVGLHLYDEDGGVAVGSGNGNGSGHRPTAPSANGSHVGGSYRNGSASGHAAGHPRTTSATNGNGSRGVGRSASAPPLCHDEDDPFA